MNDTDRFGVYRDQSVPYVPGWQQAEKTIDPRGSVPYQEGQAQQPRSATLPQQRPVHVQPQGKPAARMPKAQALVLLRKLKRGVVIASLLCFGGFSVLVMGPTVGAVVQQTTTTTTQKTTVSTPTTPGATPTTAVTQQPTPAATATPTPATTQQGGGYGFGSSNSNQPVSRSHTS